MSRMFDPRHLIENKMRAASSTPSLSLSLSLASLCSLVFCAFQSVYGLWQWRGCVEGKNLQLVRKSQNKRRDKKK